MRTLPLVFGLLGGGCAGSPAPVEIHFAVAAGVDGASLAEASDAERLFPRAVEALRADRLDGVARTDGPVPDLGRWYRVSVPADRADAVAAALSADPKVTEAFVAPIVAPASLVPADGDRCPVRTPAFDPRQGYLGPAPGGIDAPAAWARPGGRGAGVWFADVEGGWNAAHEDLPAGRIEHVSGRPMTDRGWIAHGTAVLGEVAAADNGLGMVGIAPDVERLFTASIGGSSTAAAIDAAQARLRPGDVLLIELHAVGPRGRWLPVEYWTDAWDAIKVATARGVVVVEAAGNGAEDLDDPAYGGRLDPSRRDSGAIVVGAGAPARDGYVDRSRLDFSNYGRRVDVQGWGREVATLDYGDLQACSVRAERDYTARFSGTSSASPVVAGAIVALEGAARARGTVLSPAEVRRLLVETGSAQTDGPSGSREQHIGPRPDLARALTALDAGPR
jgi:hypothetical protein